MAENTAIQWTKHTFNPWWGCTKVGPGCDHCYAETFDKRVGGSHWGTGQPRRLVKDWSKPRQWNREAAKTGERPWVFCASMADVFDNEVPNEWRERLWNLVRECQNLNWQFVTKRVGNVRKMLPADWDLNFRHCGIIATIVNQDEADRDVGKLTALKPTVHWIGLSIEPQLGPIDLNPWLGSLDWIITGGESGHGARPYDPRWALSLIEQGHHAMVPVFVKQMGAKPIGLKLTDKKGGDWNEWPDSLSVRQMPRVRFPRITTPHSGKPETLGALTASSSAASEVTHESPTPARDIKTKGEEALTADFTKNLPGGKLDDSTYQQIEDALDAIEAPMRDGTRWLTLAERIRAIKTKGESK